MMFPVNFTDTLCRSPVTKQTYSHLYSISQLSADEERSIGKQCNTSEIESRGGRYVCIKCKP